MRLAPVRKDRLAAVLAAVFLVFSMPPALRAQEEYASIDGIEQAAAEPETPPNPGLPARVFDAVKREVQRYGSDSLALVKAPASWNERQWQLAGGAVVLVSGLMLADQRIDKAIQNNRSDFTDKTSSLTNALGAQGGFYVSGGLWIAGALFKHENMRETGRDAFEAGVVAYVFGYVLKHSFGRKRPEDSDGKTVFVPFSSHDSFPSGHATEAFAVASVVAARSKSWIIPTIAYAAATIVAFDRLNNRVHFASDVLAGGFLGAAIGHFIVHRHGEQEKGVFSKATLDIVPIPNGLAARVVF